jgi:hypothetical protein
MYTSYSAFLFTHEGTLVVQRGASHPAVWSNTCRGTLAAGEHFRQGVACAVDRELGMACAELALIYSEETEIGQRAVLCGHIAGIPFPDTGRVLEIAGASWHDFLRETWRAPHHFCDATRDEALLLEIHPHFKSFVEALPQPTVPWRSPFPEVLARVTGSS